MRSRGKPKVINNIINIEAIERNRIKCPRVYEVTNYLKLIITDFCEITRFLSERNTIISPSENTKKLLQYFESNYILCMTSHYLWSFILKCHIHRSVTFNVTNEYCTGLYSFLKYWNYVLVNRNITELVIQWSVKWTNKYELMNIEQLLCFLHCLH